MARTPQAPHPGHLPGREPLHGPIGRANHRQRRSLPDPAHQAWQDAREELGRQVAELQDPDEMLRLIGCHDPLVAACIRALVFHLEGIWMTTRGMNMRAPSTCMPPVSSNDVDDVVVNVAVPIGVVGAETVILTRTTPQMMVLKGLGVEIVTLPAAPIVDPYTELQVFLRKQRGAIGSAAAQAAGVGSTGPYYGLAVDVFGSSIVNLQPLTALAREGEIFELVVRRTVAVTAFQASARWKGWEWTPAAITASPATSSIAY